MTANDQLLLDLADRVKNRFYGKYRGVVTEVDEATLRVKAKVPAVLLDQPSGWAMPCVPYAGPQVGVVFLPEPGSGVWIEFEGGDVSYPIWVGCYWHVGEHPPEAKADAKVLISKKTKIVLDDGAGTSTWSDANNNTLTASSDGVAIERESMSVKVGTAKVAVNGSALEVT